MPATTNYIWDEDNYLAESDGTNTINVVYTNEPQRYGNLVSSRILGTTSYHEFDALGSTRQLTSAAGGTTDTAVYDAWGIVVFRTGATGASMQWIGESGYYSDPETVFAAIRRRTYGPAIARWTSVDPFRVAFPVLELAGHHPAGANAYNYALDRPINLIDPSGQLAQAAIPAACFLGCIGFEECARPIITVCVKIAQQPNGQAFGACVWETIGNMPLYGRIICGGAGAGCIACIIYYVGKLIKPPPVCPCFCFGKGFVGIIPVATCQAMPTCRCDVFFPAPGQ
jgi:RHS repeat-associated protein